MSIHSCLNNNSLKAKEHVTDMKIDNASDKSKSASTVDDALCTIFSPTWAISGGLASHLLQQIVRIT